MHHNGPAKADSAINLCFTENSNEAGTCMHLKLGVFWAILLPAWTLIPPLRAASLITAPPTISFPLTLIDDAATRHATGNIAISPLSVGVALAVTATAADGRTARAFEQTLGTALRANADSAADRFRSVAGGTGGPVIVRTALWVPKSLPMRPGFSAKPYDAPITAMPTDSAAAAQQINAWVASATDDKIPLLVAPSINTSGFVVTNAVYFKGRWLHRFDISKTSRQNFRPAGTKSYKIPMMRQTDLKALYWSSGDLESVRLPFEGGILEYVILTSKRGSSADSLLTALSDGPFADAIVSGRGYELRQGLVAVPRHRVEFAVELRPTLERLGLNVAFSAGADFSALSDAPLSLDSVQQRALLVVDESGAEAAAATAVLATRSVELDKPPPLHFIADRPFVAILVNKEVPEWPIMIALVRDL